MGAFAISAARFFKASARRKHVAAVDADPVQPFIERVSPAPGAGILRVRLQCFLKNAGCALAARAVLVDVVQSLGKRAFKMMSRKKGSRAL